ncbi:MAG: gamma-glutamyltransferase [Gemmatimonadaceae bacterium]
MRSVALLLVLPLFVARAQSVDVSVAGARDPVYAHDGRLALSVRGDIWIVGTKGQWKRITSGPAWDRTPSWSTDGTSLVFSSNRSGHFNIWQIAVGDTGGVGELTPLTSATEDETEPVLLTDGRLLFVRGRGSASRLWIRERDGKDHRITNGRVAERWPVLSPDGERVAFVAITESGRRLVVRSISSAPEQRGADSTIVTASGIERPAWSPNGDRLTYTTAAPRRGVFVVPTDGHYTNLVSARHAASAWMPGGRQITLVELPEDDVDYNGDPDRLGDRDAQNLLSQSGALWNVDAPAAPDAGLAVAPETERAPFAAADERGRHNIDALNELAARITKLYYDTSSAVAARARWESLVTSYRTRAANARNDDELRGVLHALLRERPSYRQSATGRAAISSAHPVATAAGLEILRRGGNVVDAAAAVSFTLGVVEPDASGPGGYGQMLVYRTSMARPQLIEFMTRVPEDAGLGNASVLQNGRLPDDGPVLANVPGTVAAMQLAVKKYGSGKVTWADIIAPAIRAARNGYVVSEGLATTLATEREHFSKYDGSRALFFRNGQPLHAGDTLKNPDLAWTLEQIAAGGADAFYRGEVARRIVADLRGKGNAIQLTDLARYYAAEREPVAGTYRGYTLYSSAPPVAGGAQLVSTLNLLEQFKDPKPYADDATTLHAMLSAWLLVPSTRNRIADPGLWPVNIEPFTSRDTARARWRCFDPSKALAPEMLRGDSLPCATQRAADGNDSGAADSLRFHHATGTTAFMVADADGNIVAVTQTLGTWGGNFYVTPGLGFLYNDKLASYSTDPGAYGARLPFARHGSTIAPTIVFRADQGRSRPVAAVGAAGNAWITSAVYQTLVGIIDDHLDPQAALELPRFLPSSRGSDGITIEMEDGFSPEVMRQLVSLGYKMRLVSLLGELREGYGAALTIGNGSVTAGADPRRAGAAGAVERN